MATHASRLQVTASDLSGYGPVEGLPELREALAEILHVRAADLIVTTGASEALQLSLTCMADPGDTVRTPRPAFPGFDQLASLSGLRIEHYTAPGDLSWPEPPEVTATVICTPHNPTGVITSRTVLPTRTRGWTIWDISHTSLFGADADEFRHGLAESEILVCSLSKLLRLPGARLGCLISGSSALIRAVTAAKTHMSISAGLPGQMLALELRDPAMELEMKHRQRGSALV
ncbi:pyridoxal phosphate-dependent aminotransferase [Streptomyces chartreusis]|uniref:Pyridoxal phosphate-dependent aminotransferase n=1 Tax=Streptomyces chartreusis TaxID=1969 RepID=A0A7H8TDJ2_STRCX|nr:pyridoxal phosphate-dependent aminotransferase [Streptomyces chartreusis]